MKKRLLTFILFCTCSLIMIGCGTTKVTQKEPDFSTFENSTEDLLEISTYPTKEDSCSSNTNKVTTHTSEIEESRISAPKTAEWDSLLWGRATWSTVTEADHYEIEFLGKTYTVTQNWYDLAEFLNYTGSNSFKVRACSVNNIHSDWKSSEILNLTEATYWNEYPDGAFPHNVNSKTYPYTNTWIYEKDSRYYLNQYGIKAAGWLDNNGKRYYMDDYGSMCIGWKCIGGFDYYFAPEDGHMVCCTSIKIDGTRYNFDNQGHLVTNIWMREEETGGLYYVDSTGNRVTNQFFTVDEETYYSNASGLIVTGRWMQIDGDYYYFYSNGRLAKNTFIDEQHSVDNYGRLIK